MDILLKNLATGLGICKTQVTLRDDETPPLFVDPFIHRGYRQPYKSLMYYLYSVFQFHSETFNVWTHLIAFMVFIYNLHWYIHHMDIIYDPLSWGYLTFSAGSLSYSFFSALAHLCHSQSEKLHYLCFQLDYMGIGLACHGTAIGLYFFAGNEQFYQSLFGSIFIISYTILAASMCMFLSYGKMKFSKPYPITKKYIALGINGLAFLYACIPLYYTFYDSLCHKDWSHFHNKVWPHLHYIFYFLSSGFFFASHVPERFFPGSCDIIGQGHQIFHVLLAYCSCTQYSNLYEIYRTRPKHLIRLANPGLHNTLLPLIVIAIIDLLFIYVTRDYREKRAGEEHRKAERWINIKHK